jgi:RecA-family ATPase
MPEYESPYEKAAEGLSAEDLGLTPNRLPLSKVKRDRVHWLWPGRLPKGKLVILDGDPDVGKSTLSVDLGARLTTGTPLPDGYVPDGPTSILHLQAEDGIADTVLPRLLAAGGDPERWIALQGMPDIDELGRLTYRMAELPTDCLDLGSVVERDGIGLVIIDPLVAFLADWVNSHKDQQIRRALAPLAQMAEATGVTVLAIRHLNKSSDAPALYRGGGSIGILAAARLVLIAAHDPDNEGRRLLASLKSNVAPKAETLAYRIVPNELYDCGEISWQGTSKRSAAEILAMSAATSDPDERTSVEAAVLFLIELVPYSPEEVDAKDVYSEAHQQGVHDRTLEKAKALLGIESRRVGGVAGKGHWVWSRPNPDELLDSGE